MADIIIVDSFLSENEIEALQFDCALLQEREPQLKLDPANLASSLDPFEFNNIHPHSLIRSDQLQYCQARFSTYNADSLLAKYQYAIQNLLFTKFPGLLKSILSINSTESSDSLYLFNEHYVVKPPNSELAFRWHRDGEEQLQAIMLPDDMKPIYFSIWCALDHVSEENGTIAFPTYFGLEENYCIGKSCFYFIDCF